MIEARGTVVASSGQRLWVEIPFRCKGCDGRCGRLTWTAKSRRFHRIEVWAGGEAEVGDEVGIGLPGGRITGAVAVVCLLPLSGLLAGTVVSTLMGFQGVSQAVLVFSVFLSAVAVTLAFGRRRISATELRPILLGRILTLGGCQRG